MSGVKVGTRLEQLEALARKVNQEIALERRRLALNDADRPGAPPSATVRRPGLAAVDSSLKARLQRLGVSVRDVKEWAVREGLLAAVTRGRVAVAVVDAYEESLTTQDGPRCP